MKKKLLALALTATMLLGLTACGAADNKDQTPATDDSKTYTVGICQLVQHPALDAATQGFMDSLKEELGDKVTFDNQNASNDIPMCSTIVNQFVSNGVDLIMANSQYQVDVVKAELEKMGITANLYSFSDSNDLAGVTEKAAAEVDVIYAPTDNTVANNTGIIDNTCQPKKVPVIAGEEGICRGCGVATLSISYYDLGVATGKMAAKILTGEADISTMPIEYAPQFTKKYNSTICDALGLTAPEGYVAIG